MSDYGELVSLVAGLALNHDHQESVGYPALLADDASFRYTSVFGETIQLEGKEAVVSLVKEHWPPTGVEYYHVVSAPMVDLDGDNATIHYYTLHLMPGETATPAGLGEYEVRARREADGKWRMVRMEERQLLPYDKF